MSYAPVLARLVLPRAILAFLATLLIQSPVPAQQQHSHEPGPGTTVAIPASVRQEHETIHSALVEATRASGQVGATAKALAEVLHPHFVREEEIALPPLGALEPLAQGKPIAGRDEILEMTGALRAELPRMLEEHVRIKAAVAAFRAAAVSASAGAQVRLADDLALHAQTEEQVLYPAAIVVGDVLRARPAK